MTELALAAFAAEADAHVVSRPRSGRFTRFAAGFDERGYLRELERRGVRFLARSDARFPPLLGAIHDVRHETKSFLFRKIHHSDS